MNDYSVALINYSGCVFDTNDSFTNLKEARSWATGRGQTFDFGNWHDYTVEILKNGEPFKKYRTR